MNLHPTELGRRDPYKLSPEELAESLGSGLFRASEIDHYYVEGLVVHGKAGEPVCLIPWDDLEEAMRAAGRLKREIYVSQPDTNLQHKTNWLKRSENGKGSHSDDDEARLRGMASWPAVEAERERVEAVKEEFMSEYSPQRVLERVTDRIAKMEQIPLAPRCQEYLREYHWLLEERERLHNLCKEQP